MKVINYIFFYEDCNATKDSSSLSDFFTEAGYFKEGVEASQIISYPVVGGVMLEHWNGELLTEVCVLWEKRPKHSFCSQYLKVRKENV